MVAFFILKAETKPFEVQYDDPIIRGSFVNYDHHDLTLTIETDFDYLNEGRPEFVLYDGSLLIDSGRIDHINKYQYALTGKSDYKLCFIDKSLVVLIDNDKEIIIFDEFRQSVVSYDQSMFE